MEFVFNQIILQPTSLCNLDCKYCYLPERKVNHLMSVDISKKLAADLMEFKGTKRLVWHGGEPLSCGIKHFSSLLAPFKLTNIRNRIYHSIQTNATLINEDWCKFFIENKIKVGVSIDGPPEYNRERVDYNDKQTYDRTLSGIKLLNQYGINYSVICVISRDHYSSGYDLFDFFSKLGCKSVGFNTQEKEGVNQIDTYDSNEIKQFWGDLFNAWKSYPNIRIREIGNTLSWMKEVCSDAKSYYNFGNFIDLIPTIGWNGDVVTLSPELLGASSKYYNNFIAGNIINDSLKNILNKARNLNYVTEFIEGWRKCQNQCEYFNFCGGGQASNKYYETGKLNVTETTYCRNVKKRLVDSIVENL